MFKYQKLFALQIGFQVGVYSQWITHLTNIRHNEIPCYFRISP